MRLGLGLPCCCMLALLLFSEAVCASSDALLESSSKSLLPRSMAPSDENSKRATEEVDNVYRTLLGYSMVGPPARFRPYCFLDVIIFSRAICHVIFILRFDCREYLQALTSVFVCPVQTGVYSNTVVLQHHSVVMTKADKIYKVKCTYDMSSKNITFGMMPIR